MASPVVFTGGMVYRKNVDGLITAYAGLPGELRDRYALVVVGRLGLEDARGPFAEHATPSAFRTASSSPDTWRTASSCSSLYQATSLFVFPSRYGFGLPVIEALACCAPAIVGRNSSLVELVDAEEALFDTAEPIS